MLDLRAWFAEDPEAGPTGSMADWVIVHGWLLFACVAVIVLCLAVVSTLRRPTRT
jgi:hypothetical protein